MSDGENEQIEKAARALGLRVRHKRSRIEENESFSFEGVFDGHTIKASVALTPKRGAGSKVFATALIEPPLDLGLQVTLDDSDSYATPVVTADEPARAEQLMASGLRAAFRPGSFGVTIHDSSVVVGFFDQYREWRDSPAEGLAKLIEMTRELRQQVSAGRPAVQGASALAGHAAAWRAVAAAQGGALTHCPLSLVCEAPHLVFEAHSKRTGAKEHEVSLQGRFEPPLGLGLQVHHKTFTERIAQVFGARHLTLSDPDFDAEFSVFASSEEGAVAALSPEVRALLLGLSRQGPTRLDDEGLQVTLPGSLGEAEAQIAVENALTVALTIASVIHGESGSPYRLTHPIVLPSRASFDILLGEAEGEAAEVSGDVHGEQKPVPAARHDEEEAGLDGGGVQRGAGAGGEGEGGGRGEERGASGSAAGAGAARRSSRRGPAEEPGAAGGASSCLLAQASMPRWNFFFILGVERDRRGSTR